MKSITRHIDRLYLDPNNYRFRDKSEYRKVEEDILIDPQIQKRTRFFLTGEKNELIQDLITSFRENGFLSGNQIQIKELKDNKYLVLEGNRRVATLKYLYEEWKNKGIDIGKLNESSFRSVSVVLHAGESTKEHLIAMGLDHITGKKKWSPLNQAQLIEDLTNQHKMSESQICKSLGLTKHRLRRAKRTFALINRYKQSEYEDQFKSSMYTVFEEIIKKPDIKDTWLQWNEAEMKPLNTANEERIFSWISEEEKVETNEDGEEVSRNIQDPIITKSSEIRELAKYINDSAAIEQMEAYRSITEGFMVSEAVGEKKFQNALKNLKQNASVALNLSEHMQEEHLKEVQIAKDKIDLLLPLASANISPYAGAAPVLKEDSQNYFSNIQITYYRRLKKINLRHLNRINIFAGKNNSGKTSLLEAVFLLSQLNDINAFLESERYRGKFHETLNSQWLWKNLNQPIQITGEIDELKASIVLTQQEETSDYIDKSGYLSSVLLKAKINGNQPLETTLRLFSNREPEILYEKNNVICRAALSSPYRYNEALLKKAHALAVQERFIDDIIDFIREHIDPSIIQIRMVSIDGESRFYVESNSFSKSSDITNYGEGVLRVFEIALFMAYCRNGILCVDEFESAIHKSLLIDFSRFVHQLAERFNVQVFLSTHSKECVDAFIQNKYKNDEVIAFVLREKEDGNIESKYVKGERLESLIESIDIDIREH